MKAVGHFHSRQCAMRLKRQSVRHHRAIRELARGERIAARLECRVRKSRPFTTSFGNDRATRGNARGDAVKGTIDNEIANNVQIVR